MERTLSVCILLLSLVFIPSVRAYPIDGYEATGIRRLERLRLIAAGELEGPTLVTGARRPTREIGLRLLDQAETDVATFTQRDSALQRELDSLFPDRHESYSVALLVIGADGGTKYAAYQEDRLFSPGSVGKLAVVTGLFAELKRLYPDDTEARRKLLKERMVTAGDWVLTDHHPVPIYDPDTGAFVSRPAEPTDTFNLYEWTDHMMSASANSAASVVWKEVVLMRAFGAAYPPSPEEEAAFFKERPRAELGRIGGDVVNTPLRELGIPASDWRLGSLFTNVGQKRIPTTGGSAANPRGMMRFLIQLEQGKVVDAWSSLEIKKLMYMTAKRIRYASTPAIARSLVYFKSGSLYRCQKEEGFACKKYHGNVENAMNSVAIVERTDGTRYLVALMSNVLRKNSAVDHQNLATEIDRIIPTSRPKP